jgi:hypothetical protein
MLLNLSLLTALLVVLLLFVLVFEIDHRRAEELLLESREFYRFDIRSIIFPLIFMYSRQLYPVLSTRRVNALKLGESHEWGPAR